MTASGHRTAHCGFSSVVDATDFGFVLSALLACGRNHR